MSRYNKISQNQDGINNFLDDYYQEFQKTMKERRDGRYNSRRPDMRRNRMIQDHGMSQPHPPGSHGPYEAGNLSSVHPYNNDVSMRMEYSYPPPFNPNVPPPINPNVPPMYPQPYSEAQVPPQYSTLHMPPPMMIPVNRPPLPPVRVGPPLPMSPPPLPPPPPLPSPHLPAPSLPPPPGTAVIVLPTNHHNSDEDSDNEDEEGNKLSASSASSVVRIKENIVDYSNSSSDSSDHSTKVRAEENGSKESPLSQQKSDSNPEVKEAKHFNKILSQESSACETPSEVEVNKDNTQNIVKINCNDNSKFNSRPDSRTCLQNTNFKNDLNKSKAIDLLYSEEHTTPSDLSDHDKEAGTSSDGLHDQDSSDMLLLSQYPGPPLSPPPSPFLSREIYLKFHEIWVQQMEEEEMEARRNYLQREIEKHDRKHYSSKRHRKEKKLKRRLKIYGENILLDKKKHKNHSVQDSLKLSWEREQKCVGDVSSTVNSVMKSLLHDLTETLKMELSRRLLDEAVSKLNKTLGDKNAVATE